MCGIGNTDAGTVARNTEGDTRVATATWSWFPANRTVVDARYIHMEENAENLPVVDLGFQPTFNPNNLASMGQYSDTTGPFAVTRGAHNLRSEQVDYKRNEFRATITQFFDVGGTNHQFKGGFGYEEGSEILDRKSNGWGTLAIVSHRHPGDLLHGAAGAGLSRQDLQSVRAGRHQHRLADWCQRRRAAESRRVRAGSGRREHLPHLQLRRRGAAATRRQLSGAQGSRRQGLRATTDVTTRWTRRAAPDPSHRRACSSPTPSSIARPARCISNVPRASTTGKLIDAGLKPTYSDEWLIGYATPFSDQLGAGSLLHES